MPETFIYACTQALMPALMKEIARAVPYSLFFKSRRNWIPPNIRTEIQPEPDFGTAFSNWSGTIDYNLFKIIKILVNLFKISNVLYLLFS